MLALEPETREKLYQRLIEIVLDYQANVEAHPVLPVDDPATIRDWVTSFKFDKPGDPIELIDRLTEQLRNNQVNTSNPGYYGLFNPRPATMSIAADTIVAAFNPQLASWNHSPLAIEIEQHLIRCIASEFGFPSELICGTFTSGGAEANHTAIACALHNKFPEFKKNGLRGLAKQPVLYTSAEGHHSVSKAARLSGLGDDAVRLIEVGDDLKISLDALRTAINEDLANDQAPFMVIGTAGTTNAGIIDRLSETAAIARQHNMWYHIDAAWGGAAIFLSELRFVLEGASLADSITFDCHKWLSVPMGAGLFLSRHKNVLNDTFNTDADYMPKDGGAFGFIDPWATSMQWSRRFIGLKVFLALAERGWNGYSEVIRHQVKMGDYLKKQLRDNGWNVLNETPLPIACFNSAGSSTEYLDQIARAVVNSNKAWISTTRIGNSIPVLRACITNYSTSTKEIDFLIEQLKIARDGVTEQMACSKTAEPIQ